jgi:hypothetical protein
MFTKRSILVGLVVLFAARLVSAAVGQSTIPFPGVYLLDDGIHKKVRNAGLDDWLVETIGLDSGFPLRAIVLSEEARSPGASSPRRAARRNRFPRGGYTVTIDVFSTGGEIDPHRGTWGSLSYDPLNPTSLMVSRCGIDGIIPPGSSWSAGDFLQQGAVITGTMPSIMAISSGGIGQVSFFGQPPVSGSACQPMGGLTEILTNTGFGGDVEIIGSQMWVNRSQSLGSPGSFEGGFDVFDLSVTMTSVEAALVGSVEGGAPWEYYGGPMTELNGGYMVAGSPYCSPPRASAFGVQGAVTSTVGLLGSFEVAASGLGYCVENAGDVNGDYFDDVLVCSYDNLYIVSGKSLVQAAGGTVGAGAVLAEIVKPASGISFARDILANVDYNGDGVPDVVVSAPEADPWGLPDAGRIYVYDGGTGSLLTYFDGREAGDRIGGDENSIIALGDLGARDGLLDFAFRVPGHRSQFFLTTTMVTYEGDVDLRPSNNPFPRTNFNALLAPGRLLRSSFQGGR